MVGKIVYSLSGRDKGKYLVVINCDNNYVFVADGKERKLQSPKRKNIKQKQYCNKFNRDLKNGLHPNIIISIY